jgi:proteasome alpha subunit
MGGQAEQVTAGLQERWQPGLTLSDALGLGVELLSRAPEGGQPRTLTAGQLEVAILDRARPRRAFRRLAGPLLERLLRPDDPTTDVPHEDDPRPGLHDTLTGESLPESVPPGTPDVTDVAGGADGDPDGSGAQRSVDGM